MRTDRDVYLKVLKNKATIFLHCDNVLESLIFAYNCNFKLFFIIHLILFFFKLNMFQYQFKCTSGQIKFIKGNYTFVKYSA